MKKRVYFIDFDGTITLKDTCDAMTKAFAKEGWQESLSKWEKGQLTTQDCAREIFNGFAVKKEELAHFLREIPIDETFKDFVKYVETRGERIFILSDGYDFNISLILEKAGLGHLEYYCNEMLITDQGYDISSPHQAPYCTKCGTCKEALVASLRKTEEEVIYVGDGYSDMCGCQKADLIFAKSHLLKYCLEKDLPVIPFYSFQDILLWFKEEKINHDA